MCVHVPLRFSTTFSINNELNTAKILLNDKANDNTKDNVSPYRSNAFP